MAGSGTYHVIVKTIAGMVMDKETFPFGQFKEIGYWLDNCGYNDSRYKVTIIFQED
jgi:hypothetical protein